MSEEARPARANRALVDLALLRAELGLLLSEVDAALGAADEEAAGALLARARATAPGALGEEGAAALFLNAPVGQATIDPAGTLHAANAGVLRLFGIPIEEAAGLGIHRRVPRDARPDWFGLLHTVFDDRRRGEVELPVRLTGGERRWLRVVASPLPEVADRPPRALALFWDVSEERAALARLRQSEAGFRSLIERLPEAVIVHRAGVVHYANPAAGRCFGVAEPVELVGEDVERLVADADLAAARAAWLTAVRTRDAGPTRVGRLCRADGETWVARITDLLVVFDGDWAVVTVAHDLTEQRALQARLMLADRLSNMGTLAAGLAHEINNPLQYMMANTEVVRGELRGLASAVRAGESEPAALADALDEAAGHLADVASGERRVADLVRELRGFSRVSDERTAVSIPAVVRAALRVAGNELQFRARLELDLPGDLPPVYADEGRLFQVFLNLLINAAQAIPPGAADRHRVSVTARGGDGVVVVSVEDTGCGMSSEQVERVFEPFYTTKEVGQGTGLGLAICATIVRGMDGSVEVSSSPGEGSTFRVTLPVLAELDDDVPPLEPAPPPARPRRRRVLLVDDERAIRDALSRALGRRHDVVAVAGAVDAIAVLESDAAFDLVLSDVLMDRGSGADLHNWIALHRPALSRRLAFMTGGAFLPAAAEFVRGVRVPVIEKPVTVEQVEELLSEPPDAG